MPGFYMVQTGILSGKSQRGEGSGAPETQGFPAFMTFKDGLYYVRAGAFRNMEK